MFMFSERQLRECYSDYRDKYCGQKEDYVAALYLARRFRLSQEDALKWVTFGGFDYGIDAYYLDEGAGNLFLYQFKWSDDVLQMARSIDRLVDKGIDVIFGSEPVDTQRNDIINRLRADVRERQNEIKRVFLYFISKGPWPPRGSNAALDSRLEDLERASSKIAKFFPGNVEVLIRVNDDATPPPQFCFPLTWSGNGRYELDSGETLSIGFVSLVDLVNMYEKMGLRLLQKNIRAGLTEDTPPNRALKKAFQEVASGKGDPKTFAFRHNGVSIEVSHLVERDGAAEIVEPRVLNGAQTIVTLHRLLSPAKGEAPGSDEVARLSEIRVLAKIVYGCDESFVTEVTIANNKQNPVKPWNLRASDRYQIDLEQRFADKVKLHYDRLQNSYRSRSEAEWEEEGIQSGKVLEIEKLGLALAAASGEIDKMSRMPEVWEQETSYREIFKPRYIEEDYDLRRIVLCYKVQYCLRALVAEIASKGEKKYGFIARGRNLVWALTIQALLNDSKCDELLEDFGEDLKAGADFKERLTKIAAIRLVPILNSAISLPTYRELIKAEKFSFLKTNAFFRVCRNLGGDKFEWTVRKL